MKPVKISVLISKKLSPKASFDSYSVSYGTTAELEPGENYRTAIRRLAIELKDLVNEGLVPETKIRVVKNL